MLETNQPINEVCVLFEGYSKENPGEKYLNSNCTCTLIKSKGYNVIVDTMTIWDADKIIKALELHNLKPKDINAVISTHGHSDHIGNNNLFLDIEWLIVGQCISVRDKYLKFNFEEESFHLTEDITVIATPGHTLSCVSVLVKNTNFGSIVGISGDLFEKKEDIEDSRIWITAGSESPSAQRNSRIKVANICDYIIPGHGEGFYVTDQIRCKLKQSLTSEI